MADIVKQKGRKRNKNTHNNESINRKPRIYFLRSMFVAAAYR